MKNWTKPKHMCVVTIIIFFFLSKLTDFWVMQRCCSLWSMALIEFRFFHSLFFSVVCVLCKWTYMPAWSPFLPVPVRESTESWPRLWSLFFGGAICAYAYRPDNTQCSFNIDTYLSNESCNSTDRQISSIVWYFLLDPIHSIFIIGYFLLFSNRLTPIKPPSDNTFCLSGRVRS